MIWRENEEYNLEASAGSAGFEKPVIWERQSVFEDATGQ